MRGVLPRDAERLLAEGTRLGAGPTFAALRAIDSRFVTCEYGIEDVADLYFAETRYLRSNPEVDARTAVGVVLAIGDPCRFRSSHSLGPYLYLTKARPIGVRRLLNRSGENARRAYLEALLIEEVKMILGCRRDGYRVEALVPAVGRPKQVD